MKTISVYVSSADYEAFREASRAQHRSIAQLIREAMAFYREKRLDTRSRLADLPVLAGHRPVGSLPSRYELFDEAFTDGDPE